MLEAFKVLVCDQIKGDLLKDTCLYAAKSTPTTQLGVAAALLAVTTVGGVSCYLTHYKQKKESPHKTAPALTNAIFDFMDPGLEAISATLTQKIPMQSIISAFYTAEQLYSLRDTLSQGELIQATLKKLGLASEWVPTDPQALQFYQGILDKLGIHKPTVQPQ